MANLNFYLDLTLNLALLVALTILSEFLDRRIPRIKRAGALAQGLLFGAVAILGMLRPVVLGPGLIFDGRSIMISLCALYFGPIAALASALPVLLVRIFLGGVGTIMGILVVSSSALIGLAARPLLDPDKKPPASLPLWVFGLCVHAAMVACAFSLPDGSGPSVALRIGPPVMALYPLATILAGTLLSDRVASRLSGEELARSEERFMLAMEASSEGIWDRKVDTGESYYSPAWFAMLGYSADSAAGLSWDSLLHPEDREGALRADRECVEGLTDRFDIEFRLKARDGNWRWIRSRGKCMARDRKGRATRLVGTHEDITSRKEIEAGLERSLAEKEILLREVHHRVKNNLNVISSLLSLQASMITEAGQAIKSFEDARDRVQAMAFVHEEIYRSKDHSKVDMGEYVSAMASRVLQAEGTRRGVRLEIDVGGVSLPVDASIPCGLIVNELVTNAFRHAFPERGGRVWIRLAEREGNYRLTVGDDGIGLPEGAEDRSSGSLGLCLVQSLVEQLGGRLELRRSEGTVFTIEFRGDGRWGGDS